MFVHDNIHIQHEEKSCSIVVMAIWARQENKETYLYGWKDDVIWFLARSNDSSACIVSGLIPPLKYFSLLLKVLFSLDLDG